MTKGQRAMAVAMIYPEADKTAPGKTSKTKVLLENKSIQFSGATLSQARTVLRILPQEAAVARSDRRSRCHYGGGTRRSKPVLRANSSNAAHACDTASCLRAPGITIFRSLCHYSPHPVR
jgi:hypothetical protein